MRLFRVALRFAFFPVLAFLLISTQSLRAAEIVTLVDTDRNVGTGCVLHAIAGVDTVVTARIASAPSGMSVASLRLQQCVGGTLGPVTHLPNGWPVPRNEQQFNVETFIPYANLGISRTTPARFAFVLLQDGASPVRVPADGSMLTFGAPTRRRSAAPAYQGVLPAADGNLADWAPTERIVSDGRMALWMSAGHDALFLRFDVQPGTPIAVDDEYIAPSGATLTVDAPGVLANDLDAEGDSLSAELVTPATHGTVTLESDGSFVYQHDGSSYASDGFTYRARDGFSASEPATVTLTPVVLNEPPAGDDDSYSTLEDQPLTIAAPGVLGNDSDPDGDALAAEIVAPPAQGTVALANDGSFTFTPAPDFHGTATFTYRVSDGTSVSESVTVSITVDPVNDQPSFIAGAALTVAEDAPAYAAAWATAINAGPNESQAVAFEISGNTNPALFNVAPSISSSGQLTFTVMPNVSGTASMTVVLKDDGGTANGGVDTSASATLTIVVDAVNDAPTFTLSANATANEDDSAQTFPNFATAISAGPADESGQTLTFAVTQVSSDATLTFDVAPAIAPDGTLTFTPAANAYGSATFNVVLGDDGSATSTTQQFTISVNSINDAPTFAIVAAPPASNEDAGAQTVNGFASAISQGPNESGQTLTFQVTPTSGTLTFSNAPAIAADGTLTYTAAADAHGTATFDVALSDGSASSTTQQFTITVSAVNDAPTFTLSANAIANEDDSAQTIPNFATAISAGPADESGQTLTFAVTQTSSDATLTFSVAPSIAPDGTLTFTPNANAYGNATFNVVLSDDGSATSTTQQFTITVNAINDAPSFTIATPPPASNEDAGAQTVNGFASAISQGPNESGQTLTFQVTPTSGTLTFSLAPAIDASGNLTYTAAANAHGPATFDVVLSDGSATSAPQSFTITVNAVNDAPSFTLTLNATTNEDDSAQTIPNFATAISAGPADESGQTLAFAVTQASSDATLTFMVAPSIASDGTLTFTPNANAYGSATFNVVLSDDGSATSSTQQFTITVNAINDAPSFTIAMPPPASNEDAGAQTVNGFASAISQGPNESGQTLTFQVTPTSGTLTFSIAPAIDASGNLAYTAAANAHGTATFDVVLFDGSAMSVPQSFTITVNAVNDAPTFTLSSNATANEDDGAQTIPNFATAISAGPADESGQTLTFAVTQASADPTLTFSVAPAIAANGTLTFTPAADAHGTATFDVVLSDDGSATSTTQQFTITVNAINDAPSFAIVAAPPTSNEDAGTQTVNGFASSISQGPNETGQTLTFQVTQTAGTLTFSIVPAIDASGNLTYTAAANAHGTATFDVVLSDGDATSPAQSFTITVNAVNDAPTFTLPPSTATNEDSGAQALPNFATAISAGPADESGQTLAFAVTQTASDPTLTFSVAPSIASNGTLTFTAAANAYGSATFDVVLSDDGSAMSSTHTLTIVVNPINDAPSAQNDIFAYPTDGSSLTVAAPGVLSNDSDIDSGSLTAALVANVSEGTLSLQPDGSFTYTKATSPAGTSVTFTYQASDGSALSNVATVTITLNAPPIATADSFSTLEGNFLNEAAPGLLANDTDPDANIAQLQVVSGPDCAGYATGTCGTLTLSASHDGSFTYQSPMDFNGVVTFTYKLIDSGSLESAPATVTLTVTPVNDAPTFDALIVDASGAQGSSNVIVVPFATNILRGPVTATDEVGQNVQFETEIYFGSNFVKPFIDIDAGIASTTGVDIDSTGTLRFMPSNTAGTVRMFVRLRDDGGTENGGDDTSDEMEFEIRITAVFVNKAPSFNITNVTVNEDAAPQTVNNWVTSISPGAGESSQIVTMSVDSYTNAALFSVAPTIVSNNRLTYTLAPNAVGTSTLTIKAMDNGGTANGGVNFATKTATITINGVNDAPSFTKGIDLAYASGTTGTQSVSSWATAISRGPSDESAQTLTFNVTVRSGASIFTGTPSLASNGTLSLPLNGTTGLAVIDVRLSDNGGTANGGVNQSTIQTFTVNAGNVNSPPSFLKGTDIAVLEDSGLGTYGGWATAISPGPPADSGQTVSFSVTAATPSLFATQPAVSASGELTFTPAANQFGSTVVTVRAVDNGATAGGGVDTSDPQTFTITITAVNDAPTLSIPSPSVSGGENGGPRTLAAFASAGAGPNETGQTPFTYTVTQTSGSPTLFDTSNGGVAPAIAANGTLTFTTAVNESGSATFSVTVRDAGGTANSGVDTSTAASFTIAISTGGPTVPGSSIAFEAYANIPIIVGTLPAEAVYNLLDGASDPDLPLSVLITSKPVNARVDVASDGSFTFRSGNLAYAAGVIQPQSFKWRVCDNLGNCSAERTATIDFIGPLVFFSDASAVTSPGLYTLDVPGKSIPTGFTTNAAPPATYIIKSGTYSMGSTGATTQLSIRAGDRVYGQGIAGLTLASLGISQAALSVGTLPALPDYSTGTIPTLHMPDPTNNQGGGIEITQSPIFKGYGGGTVKHLRFTRGADKVASWILFSNASWTSTPGDYVFDDIISVNGQGFAIPQVGSSITVMNSDLTISEGFGMNGGTITVTNAPIKLTSTDTSSTSVNLFSDFDSSTPGTITATIDAASPITINNNLGHLFSQTVSNPAWMPTGSFTIDSDITITRTSSTPGLLIKLMSNVALNGKVTVTTATGKPVQIESVSNLTMPNAANTARMTSTPASPLNGGITMANVTVGAAGINLTNIDVRKGYLYFQDTQAAPTGPITITGGSVVGDFFNPCITTSAASNVTVTGVSTSNCGF